MKQCPVCEKTFDDSLRFCQVDGTPLVDKSEPPEPVDPYKTMVASKADILAAIPQAEPTPPEPFIPEPAVPAPLENEVLEIPPANDPNKTQFVSEAELRAEMEAHPTPEDNVIDISPATESAPSEIPITGDPSMAPPLEPPPSPFSMPQETGPASFPTSPPIPSPFAEKPAEPEPPTPQFVQPEPPAAGEPLVNPFEQAQAAPMAQAEFNPPAALEPDMQNPQNFGQQQFTPPAGQNKTLSLISLIAGILGLTICCGSFLPSLVALVLGFMGRSKASQDPANYGGAGLALGGIIMGAIGLIGGVVVWIVYFLYFAAIMASMPR
jgi:hypothetical protein